MRVDDAMPDQIAAYLGNRGSPAGGCLGMAYVAAPLVMLMQLSRS